MRITLVYASIFMLLVSTLSCKQEEKKGAEEPKTKIEAFQKQTGTVVIMACHLRGRWFLTKARSPWSVGSSWIRQLARNNTEWL